MVPASAVSLFHLCIAHFLHRMRSSSSNQCLDKPAFPFRIIRIRPRGRWPANTSVPGYCSSLGRGSGGRPTHQIS
ncbi:hypothetical protein BDR05DRAFT_561261 [Suillus weaverae]|nr:hypothetical protein BDR05DRAFT_561261 [Suillus weaverae]